MNNLIILLSVGAILWVLFSCAIRWFKEKGNKRRLLLLKFGVTFFVCGMGWTPMVSYYNFKYPDRHIWNLIQLHYSVKPVKVWAAEVDKKITEATNPFIPKVIKNTVAPAQAQTAKVLNEALPARRTPEGEGGVWQKVGGAVGVLGKAVKGIIGIVL